MYLGLVSSSTFLFSLQNLSHSIVMTLRDAPWLMMKLFSASTFMPLRTQPCMVGKRGSNQPSTKPCSTNHVSLRFDSTVCTKFIFPKERMWTGRSRMACWIQWYCSSRSLYSVVRSAWVTPSMESTMGHTKS